MTDVIHNPAASRFEARVDGLLSVAEYSLHGSTMQMLHTGVPAVLRGRGIAALLVKTALAYAGATGLTVEPRCSYVVAYLRRHPQPPRPHTDL